jgi:hypothetical protein
VHWGCLDGDICASTCQSRIGERGGHSIRAILSFNLAEGSSWCWVIIAFHTELDRYRCHSRRLCLRMPSRFFTPTFIPSSYSIQIYELLWSSFVSTLKFIQLPTQNIVIHPRCRRLPLLNNQPLRRSRPLLPAFLTRRSFPASSVQKLDYRPLLFPRCAMFLPGGSLHSTSWRQRRYNFALFVVSYCWDSSVASGCRLLGRLRVLWPNLGGFKWAEKKGVLKDGTVVREWVKEKNI